jgi:hypothetical protein
VIGYLQWRTAQQKAALDLFDKRYKVYETVKNSVDQVVKNAPDFDKDREKELRKAVNEAYFFFGDDVHHYLESVWDNIVFVCGIHPDELAVRASERAERMTRILEFYKIGQPLFAKYMRFSQAVPRNSFRRRAPEKGQI